MSASPRCHLTPKDFAFLEEMLEKDAANRDESFLRLLRRKLAAAIVLFPDDIGETVAASDSWVEFTVNEGTPKACVLVRDARSATAHERNARPLPISARWGLALLGLAAGETIEVEQASGAVARLQLLQVKPSAPSAGAKVLAFSRRAMSYGPVNPDNDPGPSAA
ncbi:MAG TPA: hypothetical protein VKP12_18200 [Kiloniellaceae bacterium]|nr:hypothetical protein [Kiloniellaceae bacterium]